MLAAAAVCAPPAHADEIVDSGTWSTGYATGRCTTGALSRTCTYDVNYTNCTEASVATGGPRAVVPCGVHFAGSVEVQPRFNAAGRIVGCTSVVGTERGSIWYDSSIASEFDRTSSPIPVKTLTVQSVKNDVAHAIVHVTGTVTQGLKRWDATIALTGTCESGGFSGQGDVTSGSVVVSAVTQSASTK